MSQLKTIFFILLLNFSQLFSKEQILNLSISSGLRSTDPRVCSEAPSSHIIPMLYEGLMRIDSQGSVVPGMAERFLISEDGLRYTFFLRDAFWNNHEPLTAYDFEHAWKKCINPKTADKSAYTFYIIKNAKKCQEGAIGLESVGIHVIDKKTLEITLEHPVPYFLEITATGVGYMPISKNLEEKDPDWSKKRKIVSNGAFEISKDSFNNYLLLKKNTHYWNHKNINLTKINIQVIQDESTALKLFQKGELDWVGHPLNIIHVDEINNKEFEFIDQSSVDWLWVNINKEPFSNKNFRKAICLAINRKDISTIFNGSKKPTTCVLNQDFKMTGKDHFNDGDIQQSQIFLKKALLEMNKEIGDLDPIVLSIRNSDILKSYAQAIQDQLRTVLNLTVSIEQNEWMVHFDKVKHKNYELAEMGWVAAVNDPIYILDIFRSKLSNMNMSGWENKEFQDCLEKADIEKNKEKRLQFIAEAEAILVDELPIIPLFKRAGVYQKNPQLDNVHLNHLNSIFLINAFFENKN